MQYNSIFDKIINQYPSIFDEGVVLDDYFGTLETVIDDLSHVISKQKEGIENSLNENLILALHPPRITRVIMNYKIEKPHGEDLKFLLMYSKRLALNLYQNSKNHYDDLSKFKKMILRHNYDKLLSQEINHTFDKSTWKATNPEFSKVTAEKIAKQTNGENILFIAFGHGGIPSGMDVFLRYESLAKKEGLFYITRFSVHKSHDKFPNLENDEIEYLKKHANQSTIILYDEDVATGETMKVAYKYFSDIVFKGKKILPFANSDFYGMMDYIC
ncbi:MAG: hypothetical protein WC755_05200 [Candidatus Woesearchaeota archaeon]